MANLNNQENVHVDLSKQNQNIQEKQNDQCKKSNFQKYAESNSVGGLSFVLTSKSRARRFTWLVIILVSVAISFYLVRNSFSKLIKPPTSTTIINDPNLSLEFPAVTICNVNAFSSEKLRSYGIDTQVIKEVYDQKAEGKLDTFNVTIAELATTTASDFISFCFLGNYYCDIDEDFEFYLKDLYACFTFNSGWERPIRKVNGTGKNQGLSFYFDVAQSDYSATANGDAGVRIVVHPQNEPPHPDRFGVAASPGTNIHIGFKKLIYDDQTQRSCLTEDQHEWRRLSEDVSYSYASCLEDGITDIFINDCGCILSNNYYFPHATDQYDVELCNLTNLSCYIANYFAEPPEPCQPACKHTAFEIVSATQTMYPADYLKDQEEGVILVSIFYETLNVQTQTTVYSYGVEEFFAEVGGQLGLFIGVSVITCFEFIIFLIDEVKNRIKVCFKN